MAECNMARVVKEGHLCLLDVRDTGFKKNKYWVELSTTPQEHVYRLCLYYDRFPREPWRLFPLEPNTFCGSECGKLNKRDHAEERYWALVLTTGTLLFQEGRGTRKKPAGHANSVELWDQEVRRCMRDRGRWMCQSVKSPDPPLPPEFIINLTEVSLSFTSHMANNRSARSHGRWDITHVAIEDPEYQNVKEDGQSFLKLIVGKPGKKKGIYMLKLPPQARLELVTKIRTLQSRCGPPTPPRPGLDDVQSRPLPDCPPPTVPRPPATLSPGSSPRSKPTQLSPGSSPHSKPTQLSPGSSPHSKPTQLSPGASPHSKPTQLSPGASTHTPPSQLSPRLPPHSQPPQPLFGTSTHTQHTQLSHGPSPHTQPNQLSSRTSPSTPPTQLLPGASPALDVGSDTTDHSRSPSPTRRGRSPPFRKVGATSSQLKSLGKCPTPPLPKAQASPLVPTSGPHSKHFQRPGNEGKRQLPSPTETMSKSTNVIRFSFNEKFADLVPDLKDDPFYQNPTLKGRKSTKCPPPPSEAPKDWLRKPIPAPRRATSSQDLSADEHYEESPTVELCDQEQQPDNGQKKDIMSVLMDKTLEEDSLGLPKEKWEKMLLLLCFPSPLQNDWKDLASKLGLTNTDVMLLESVRENYKKLPARYVFRYWQKHRPLPYNRQEVQRVLVDLERLELAGMFDDYCRLPIKRVS
ncbi:PREDICTED: caskin-1-like [Branchiostoma belcheri]|uniref:Caskin-1-like n=1 Tax=Branchiostoma belcheri TaxID=7741 RepID=A0A6P4XDX0_BRABE|nr:PREDICTED: caskin-1-like [Branchiostoma belcheri]